MEKQALSYENLTEQQRNDFLSKRETSVIYHSWRHIMGVLDDSEVGAVFRAFLALEAEGEELPCVAEFNKGQLALWAMMLDSLQHSREKYLQRCVRNYNNGIRGGRPRNQDDNMTANDERTASDNKHNKDRAMQKLKEEFPGYTAAQLIEAGMKRGLFT